MRGFARIDLGMPTAVPDATTLLKFRRLLETNDLCKGIFQAINTDPWPSGDPEMMREGTLVDATLLGNAPPSTKNKEKKRDPENAPDPAKGQPVVFRDGRRYIGRGSGQQTGTLPWSSPQPKAWRTSRETAELLHGQETQVHADAGYTGVAKAGGNHGVAKNGRSTGRLRANEAKSKRRKKGRRKKRLKAIEKAKASVRAFGEHPFHIVKNIFRHRKVRYRGLAKNGHPNSIRSLDWPTRSSERDGQKRKTRAGGHPGRAG